MTKKDFAVDGTMDVAIKYSEKERLELAQSLAGKKARIEKLRNELKATSTELKGEIKGIEAELVSDINTLESGVRHIPSAPVKAILDQEKKLVTIKYRDQVVSNEKLDPEKHRGLFGDLAVL
jgi:seryl-tRNA synthetase